ncbi:M15 family metallopeptidase [Blautia sp. MSJ-19]|uniref:M15 family metallopeptidase n=1 Tax=Blautia sp. MSJ-19 TaxID=2841517 RepID=UPI001C0F16BB|nr:M15 family metallopeptidase [Blautia sp. MSJ-19]MBU5482248.1 M15 family metallopeptidase [Blautia sp. MSJ-19]
MITDYTRLINKKHPLPADYIPRDLVDIGLPFTCAPSDPRRLLEKKAAHKAMELITRAGQEGISLYCISGYRSYARQKELYRHDSYVAAPGMSEHQSGLALDLSCPAVNMELVEAFSDTPEGIWLARHAPLYGFILRYPANKESITEYPYEPWHIRYVSCQLSTYLAKTGMVLEEYYAISKKIAL